MSRFGGLLGNPLYPSRQANSQKNQKKAQCSCSGEATNGCGSGRRGLNIALWQWAKKGGKGCLFPLLVQAEPAWVSQLRSCWVSQLRSCARRGHFAWFFPSLRKNDEMEAKSFVDNHPAHPLPAAIRQLLRLLEECSPDSQPEPQLLLTLERLL